MVHAKQEQPFFTALDDRKMTPVIAPAVRLFCREELTEDRTSACDIANSMLMKASTRDIMTTPLLLLEGR